MQLTSVTNEVDKVKGELNVANIESALQFVEGFKAEIEQVKVIAGDVNFEEVALSKRFLMQGSWMLSSRGGFIFSIVGLHDIVFSCFLYF